MGNSDSHASIKVLYANYTAIKSINDLRYGEGRIVQCKSNKEEFFQKEINLTDESRFKKTNLLLEKKISYQHPNLINLIKIFHSEDNQFCSRFYKIYLISEYLPTTLLECIDARILKKTQFTEEQLWILLRGSVEALSRLQGSQIAHQSIRPETISVNPSDLNVKLCDPQISNNLSTFQLLYQEQQESYQCYLSPLLMTALRDDLQPMHNPYKSDIFSLGLVMLHCAQMNSCDDCYDQHKVIIIQSVLKKRLDRLEQEYSNQFSTIVRSMLQWSEDNRPDPIQLKQDLSLITHQEVYQMEIRTPQKQQQPEYLEAVYESFSNNRKPNEVSASVNQSVVVNQDVISAKFNQPITQSIVKPRLNTSVNVRESQQVLRQDIPDRLQSDNPDKLRHIKLSEQHSDVGEIDLNLNNNLNQHSNDIDDDEFVYDANIEESERKVVDDYDAHQFTSPPNNAHSIMPVSYDSYKQQRETGEFEHDIKSNRNQYNVQPNNSQFYEYESHKKNVVDVNYKYDYLYDKSLTPQQQQSRVVDNNLNSIRKEKVIETYLNGSRYEGDKLNGLRHGQGCFFYQDNGGVYEGMWFENKMHGHGTLFYGSGKPAYEGQWVNDKFEGIGTLYNEEPNSLYSEYDYRDFDKVGEYWTKYHGGFHDDNKEGKGTLYLSNGERFEGYFLADLVSGPGAFFKKNNQVIQGRWWQNKLQ